MTHHVNIGTTRQATTSASHRSRCVGCYDQPGAAGSKVPFAWASHPDGTFEAIIRWYLDVGHSSMEPLAPSVAATPLHRLQLFHWLLTGETTITKNEDPFSSRSGSNSTLLERLCGFCWDQRERKRKQVSACFPPARCRTSRSHQGVIFSERL